LYSWQNKKDKLIELEKGWNNDCKNQRKVARNPTVIPDTTGYFSPVLPSGF